MYGYDTKVTKYFAGPTNTNSIHSHGKDLLSSLATFRKLGSPLILIAHSLGGIVVKEMLASSSSSTDDTRQDVVASTAGVIFLGTPHRGSTDLATLGDRARNMVNALGMKTNPALLDALRLKTNDLERAQESFSAVWSRYGFRVKTFQEGLGLTGLNFGPFGKKVVPDYSSLLGDVRERAETIQANHMEMCRFTGLDDPNYGRICGEITSICDWIVELGSTRVRHVDSQSFATDKLAGQPRKSRAGSVDEREQSCLQSLAFPNMNQRTQNLEIPAEGTCSWLFKHEVFVDWFDHKNQDQSCGLLWLRGKPGSGKSTLLKEACFRAREKSGPECHVASFFFNAKGDGLEHSTTGMLRSILHQICSHNTSLLKALTDFVQRKHTLSGGYTTPWENAELKSFFKTAVVGHDERIIIFIDGIDECDAASVRDVADFWRDLTKTAHATGAWLSVCLSSRHFPAVSVNDCPEIVMEDHNHSDIVEFVGRRLGLGMAARHSDQQAVQKKIIDKSGGVFLWVSLVVQDILQKNDEGKGLRFLLKHLDSVPRELEDLFYQMLTTGPLSTMVVRMFQWALLSTKQLRLHEWHHILAFIGDDPPSSLHQWRQSEFYTETDEQLEKRISHLSRGLLGFNIRSSSEDSHESADESMSDRAGAGSLDLNAGDTRVIQVIHESVRQYFIEGPGFAVLNPASAGKPLAHAHLSIMNSCLDYIQVRELDALVEARKLAQRRLASAGRVATEVKRIVEPERDRASSVASFGSAGSHDGRQIQIELPKDTWERFPDDTRPSRKRRRSSPCSMPPEESDNNQLAVHNLKKLKESTEDYDIASRWLEDQSIVDQDYSDETDFLSQPESSFTGRSQVLEAHPALLSYATFELFTHAQKADTEGVGLRHIVKRLREGAWDRWKALREDVVERTELLYFAAYLGLSTWLKADYTWKQSEVISSMEIAFDFEDWTNLGKLLDAFPSVGDRGIERAIENEDYEVVGKLVAAFPQAGFGRDISKNLFAFLSNAPDYVLLQEYLSRHPNPAQEYDSMNSVIAMKDILESKDDQRRTALHLAVMRRDKAIVSVLLDHGADASAVDFELHTPLHLACMDQLRVAGWYRFSSITVHSDIVEMLLSHRAPVNAVDHQGKTPLFMACSNIDLQPRRDSFRYSSTALNFAREAVNIVDLLLKHGADPTMRDSEESLPIFEALRVTSMSPLSKRSIVRKLLDHMSPVNAEAKGKETPLHAACTSSDVEIVKELLRRGADLTLRDHGGRSSLHIASAQSTEQVVETLLSVSGALVDAADDRGATPLHMACFLDQHADYNHLNHRLPIIRRLLAHGAQAHTVRDRSGNSAADVARQTGFLAALELMCEEVVDTPLEDYQDVNVSMTSGLRPC